MPYDANPPKPISAARNDRQAQEERYSFLAHKLWQLHTGAPTKESPTGTKAYGPDWLKTSPDRIYDQLRSSRILPAYPKDVDETTSKRLNNFVRRVLRWKVDFKFSVTWVHGIVGGDSS